MRSTLIASNAIVEKFGKIPGNSTVGCLLYNHLGVESDHYLPDLANMLDVAEDDSSMISYIRSSSIEKYGEKGINEPKHRYKTTPGRLIKKIFSPEFLDLHGIGDQQIAKFSALWNSLCRQVPLHFEILRGDKIYNGYNPQYYLKSSGSTLDNSCMNKPEVHEHRYLELYASNPDVIGLMVAKEQGLIVARALTWEFKDEKDGIEYKLLDRIYATSEQVEAAIKNWATEKAYWYKRDQNINIQPFWVIGIQKAEKLQTFYIKLQNWIHDRYPYLDTMYRLDTKAGIISNTNKDINSRWIIETRATNGTYAGSLRVICAFSETAIPAREAFKHNGKYYSLELVHLEHGTNAPISTKDQNYVPYAPESNTCIKRSDAVLCYDGSFVYTKEAVWCEDVNSNVPTSEATFYKGKYYLEMIYDKRRQRSSPHISDTIAVPKMYAVYVLVWINNLIYHELYDKRECQTVNRVGLVPNTEFIGYIKYKKTVYKGHVKMDCTGNIICFKRGKRSIYISNKPINV